MGGFQLGIRPKQPQREGLGFVMSCADSDFYASHVQPLAASQLVRPIITFNRASGPHVEMLDPRRCKHVKPCEADDGKPSLNREGSNSCNSVTAPPSTPSYIASSLSRKDFMTGMAFSATSNHAVQPCRRTHARPWTYVSATSVNGYRLSRASYTLPLILA